MAYVAQNGVHILINPNINFPVPGPGAVASRRPYPNLADGTLNCTCANSSFQSFQLTYLDRHFAGLDFQGAYSYAHSIDNSSGNSNGVGIQNPANLAAVSRKFRFRHPSQPGLQLDLRTAIRQGEALLAGARGLTQKVVGGWRINGIDTFATGGPFTPVMVSSLLNSGSAGQWPNRIGPGTVAEATIQRWYNPADFVSPGNYTFGNSGRNILKAPEQSNSTCPCSRNSISTKNRANICSSGLRHSTYSTLRSSTIPTRRSAIPPPERSPPPVRRCCSNGRRGRSSWP